MVTHSDTREGQRLRERLNNWLFLAKVINIHKSLLWGTVRVVKKTYHLLSAEDTNSRTQRQTALVK